MSNKTNKTNKTNMTYFKSKKTLIIAAVVLAIAAGLFVWASLTYAQLIPLPAWLPEKIRQFFASNPVISAADYKDGTIILVKPIATGVGEGRYEAGDIVEIRDGEELYKRFGNGNFLGAEERTQLLPLYYKGKLTAEEKKRLLEPEIAPPQSPPLRASREGGVKEKAAKQAPSPATKEAGEGRGEGKITKRRQVGVDYAQALSAGDIIKVREFEKLNRIPEIDLSMIIDKKSGLSVIPAKAGIQEGIVQMPKNRQGLFDKLIVVADFLPLTPEFPIAFGFGNDKKGVAVRNDNTMVSVLHLPASVIAYETTRDSIKNTLKFLAKAIVPTAFADSPTEVTKTVDTGGYADYLSLSAWEAGQQADLTATNEIRIAKLRYGTATSTADTTAVTIDGWTTDSTRYIKIWTDPSESYRHNGKYNTGKWRLEVGDASAIQIVEENVRIDGLQLYQTTGTLTNDRFAINVATTGTIDIQVSNSILWGVDSVSGGWLQAQSDNRSSSTSGTQKYWNNIIYGFGGGLGMGLEFKRIGITAYVYNNTVFGAGDAGGLACYSSETCIAKNNIAYNNVDNYYGTFDDASTNNLSGPTQTDAPGSNSKNGVKVQFVSTASSTAPDLHLRVGDSAARNNGANLKNDTNLAFSTDIDNENRPENGSWDIGADQVARTTQINTPLSGRFKDSSLVGYWSFDGQDMNWASSTAEALDRSGNNNNGDVTNFDNKSAVPGISGQALKFDGVNDYVTIVQNGKFNLSGQAFSVALWAWDDRTAAELSASGVYDRFVSWYDGSKSIQVGLAFERGFFIQNDSLTTGPKAASATNQPNGWHHVVATFDGSSTYRVYTDGVYTTGTPTGNATPYTGNSTDLFIGQRGNGAYAKAVLDDVRIYNRALSASEIAEQYRAGAARMKVNTPITLAGPTSGLVGNWSFNGANTNWTSATAGTTNDLSGNGNTGTMTSMSRSTSPVPGISGQALYFNEANYVDLGTISNAVNLISATPPSFSLSAWFYPKVAHDLTGIGLAGSNASDARLFIRNTNRFGFQLVNGSTYNYPATVYPLNKWYHLVGTYNSTGTELKLYINGVLGGTDTAATTDLSAETDQAMIGKSGSCCFNGIIDEVRVYNRVLTAQEILDLYNTGARKVKFKQ